MSIQNTSILNSNETIHYAVPEQTIQNNVKDLQRLETILQPGMQVTGEITANEEGVLSIKVNDAFLLSAKVLDDFQLNLGEQITFRINSVKNNQVELTPLYTNTSFNYTIDKALEQAMISKDEMAMNMVNLMMQKGMGIDKHSLQVVYTDLLNWPQIDIETILNLKELDLPISLENAKWVTMYQQAEHKLMDGFAQIYDDISKQIFGQLQATKAIPDQIQDQLFANVGKEEVFSATVLEQAKNLFELISKGNELLYETTPLNVSDEKLSFNVFERNLLLAETKELALSPELKISIRDGELSTNQVTKLIDELFQFKPELALKMWDTKIVQNIVKQSFIDSVSKIGRAHV